jgi:hypothetical protein
MASALMRRSVLTAALAAVATVASSFSGVAGAATFAATGITSTPAPDTSTTPQTVEAERPTITATFNAPLGAGSTMTLVKKGDGTNLCSSSAISGSTVFCTPDAPLPLGQTYDALGHGVAQDGSGSASSATFEFQPSYPSYNSSVPSPGGSLITGDKDHPISIVYNTNAGLDPAKSRITVRNFLDGKPGNPIAGSVTVSASSPLPNATNDTISFAPSTPLSAGSEYEVSAHVEETGESTTNPATADTLFDMFVQNAAPSNLATTAPVANNVNDKAFHFTGQAGPGQTITITSPSTTSTPLDPQATGSGSVPACGQLLCSWDVAVDVSGLSDSSTGISWTAQASDGNGVKTAAISGPQYTKDTTAPGKPVPTASISAGSTTLHVTAPNPDSPTTDVASYVVTVTDTSSPVRTLGPTTVAPNGSDALDAMFDVSSLNDGTLTATVVAQDAQGNQSASNTAKATKNVGLTPDYANSSITVNGNDVKLPAANGRAVQSPTVVTIVFGENVQPSWTDSSKPGTTTTHSSTLCVEDKASFNGSNCLNGQTTFPAANVMQTTIGFPLAETDGYHVFATAWPKAFCSNVGVGGTSPPPNCTAFASDITDPASGNPFTFTVDNTAPGAPSVNMPSSIDANSIGFVGITGSAEAGSNVVVTVRSSGGGSLLFANPGGTRADSDGHYSFVANFTGLPDGTLTVSATARDAAGNVSAAGSPATAPVLQARPSAPQNLGASAGDRQVALGWQAPATTGGHPLTSYTLTVTDLSGSGAAPQTTSVPANATSTTVGSLVNGRTYKFSLVANNDIGGGPAATTTATPKSNTVMSVTGPAHGAITYGQSFGLGGNLSYFGVGVGGQPVKVTSTYYNGAHGPSYNATTDQNGHWAIFGLKPGKTTRYTASYAGNGTYNPSSRSITVVVRALVTIAKVTARSSSHTSPVTLSGKVAPNFHGYRVYIYEVRSGGKLVKLGSAKLSTKSTWAFVHTFSKGKHLVIAKFFGRAGNATNQTGRVKITRT